MKIITSKLYLIIKGLVEFGTAVHDNDFGRAIFFLEELGDKPEAEAMWHNLANIALSINNLKVDKIDYIYISLHYW